MTFFADVLPAVMSIEAATAAGATASTAEFLAAPMVIPSTLSTVASGFPWLSAISSGGQLLSGISSRLSEASQRNAEAKAIMAQTRMRARQEFAKGMDIEAKQRAIGASSGLDVSSGTPLAIMMDTTTTAAKNANNIYYQGRLEAAQRRSEASGYYGEIPGVIGGALSTPAGTILSEWVRSRYF